MRTDSTIDRRQVKCPNAIPGGYSKQTAQFGDIVIFRDGRKIMSGRVAGRIKHAPSLAAPPICNHILVITLSNNLRFPMERWVHPTDVIEIYDPENCGTDILRFLTFLLGPAFKQESTENLRRWVYTGAETPSSGKR